MRRTLQTEPQSDEAIYGPFSTTEAPDEPGLAKDGVIMDSIKGVGRGIEDLGKSLWSLADVATFDALPDWQKSPSIFGESSTTAGKVVEGITQFATAFIPVAGWVGKAGKAVQLASRFGRASRIMEGMAAGAATDFIAYQGHEERLSNLLQAVPALRNPVTEFLAAKEDDGEIVGRFKNTIEGLGLGFMTDSLFAGIKALKALRKGKAAGLTEEALIAEAAKAHGMTPDAVAAQVEKLAAQGEDVVKRLSAKEARLAAQQEAAEKLAAYTAEDLTSGRLNKRTLRIDWAESTEDIRAVLDEVDKTIRNAHGSDFSGLRVHTENAAKVFSKLAEWDIRGIQEVTEEMMQTPKAMTGLAVRAVATIQMLSSAAKDAAAKVAQANVSGELKDLHAAIVACRRVAAIKEVNAATATATSHLMHVRKFTQAASDADLAGLKREIAKAGGNKHVKATLAKMAMLDSPEALARVAGSQTGHRFWRVHNEYWVNSILSGVKTQVVNISGSVLNTLYLPTEGFIGAALNADTRSMRAYASHALHLAQSITDSVRFAWKALSSGEPVLNAATKVDIPGGRAISPEFISGGTKTKDDGALWWAVDALGKAVNVPTRMLMATDELFKQLNYRASVKTALVRKGLELGHKGKALTDFVEGEMSRLIRQSGARFSEEAIYNEGLAEARRLGLEGMESVRFIERYVKENYHAHQGVLQNVEEFSEGLANEVTFTSDLRQGSLPAMLQNAVHAHPFLQLVVPFVRTPVNILKFFGQRIAPFADVPGLRALHKRAVEDMASGDPLRIAQVKGRLAAGTAMCLTFAELAHAGLVTGGGPRDENQRKVLAETGWQPYSIKLGNEWVSLQRLDPFASFLGVTADLVEIANRNEGHHAETVDQLATMLGLALSRNVANKSYLAGLGDVYKLATDFERYAPRLMRKQAGSYVPSLVGNFTVTAGEEELREVRTVMDALKNRVPVLGKTLDPRRNVLGEPVDARVAFTGKATDWVNPFVATTEKDDAVMAELADLQHGFQNPDTEVYGIDLTRVTNESGQTAYDRWLELTGQVKIEGKTLRQALAKLINSADYKKLPKAEQGGVQEDFSKFRVGRIQQVLSKYRKAAQAAMLREFPEQGQQVKSRMKAEGLARLGKLPGLVPAEQGSFTKPGLLSVLE